MRKERIIPLIVAAALFMENIFFANDE